MNIQKTKHRRNLKQIFCKLSNALVASLLISACSPNQESQDAAANFPTSGTTPQSPNSSGSSSEPPPSLARPLEDLSVLLGKTFTKADAGFFVEIAEDGSSMVWELDEERNCAVLKITLGQLEQREQNFYSRWVDDSESTAFITRSGSEIIFSAKDESEEENIFRIVVDEQDVVLERPAFCANDNNIAPEGSPAVNASAEAFETLVGNWRASVNDAIFGQVDDFQWQVAASGRLQRANYLGDGIDRMHPCVFPTNSEQKYLSELQGQWVVSQPGNPELERIELYEGEGTLYWVSGKGSYQITSLPESSLSPACATADALVKEGYVPVESLADTQGVWNISLGVSRLGEEKRLDTAFMAIDETGGVSIYDMRKDAFNEGEECFEPSNNPFALERNNDGIFSVRIQNANERDFSPNFLGLGNRVLFNDTTTEFTLLSKDSAIVFTDEEFAFIELKPTALSVEDFNLMCSFNVVLSKSVAPLYALESIQGDWKPKADPNSTFNPLAPTNNAPAGKLIRVDELGYATEYLFKGGAFGDNCYDVKKDALRFYPYDPSASKTFVDETLGINLNLPNRVMYAVDTSGTHFDPAAFQFEDILAGGIFIISNFTRAEAGEFENLPLCDSPALDTLGTPVSEVSAFDGEWKVSTSTVIPSDDPNTPPNVTVEGTGVASDYFLRVENGVGSAYLPFAETLVQEPVCYTSLPDFTKFAVSNDNTFEINQADGVSFRGEAFSKEQTRNIWRQPDVINFTPSEISLDNVSPNCKTLADLPSPNEAVSNLADLRGQWQLKTASAGNAEYFIELGDDDTINQVNIEQSDTFVTVPCRQAFFNVASISKTTRNSFKLSKPKGQELALDAFKTSVNAADEVWLGNLDFAFAMQKANADFSSSCVPKLLPEGSVIANDMAALYNKPIVEKVSRFTNAPSLLTRRVVYLIGENNSVTRYSEGTSQNGAPPCWRPFENFESLESVSGNTYTFSRSDNFRAFTAGEDLYFINEASDTILYAGGEVSLAELSNICANPGP